MDVTTNPKTCFKRNHLKGMWGLSVPIVSCRSLSANIQLFQYLSHEMEIH